MVALHYTISQSVTIDNWNTDACGMIWTIYRSVSIVAPSSPTPWLCLNTCGRLSRNSDETSLSSTSKPLRLKGFWFLLGATGARRLPLTLKSVTLPNSIMAFMINRNESVYWGGWWIKTFSIAISCGLLGTNCCDLLREQTSGCKRYCLDIHLRFKIFIS